jgi:hypothetical protein
MARIDFSSYGKQDVDVPFVVGKGKKKFAFSRTGSTEKLLFRRYEIYPFGDRDFISGLFLGTGDIVVKLPSPSKRNVTFDYVGYSGGGGDLKVRGFDSAPTYVGYCLLPRRAEASVRRASLELPGVRYVYFESRLEYLLVSLHVDEQSKRKLKDLREISDLPALLDRRGRLRIGATDHTQQAGSLVKRRASALGSR